MVEYNVDGLLAVITDKIDAIQPCYRLQAPQNVKLPYIVLTPVGGSEGYCFDDKGIEFLRLQISQFYDWTGNTEDGLADNVDIVAALDRESLTDDGIILRRITAPRLTVLDGKVLQITQDWEHQRYYE